MKFEYRFYEGQFLPIIPIMLKGKAGWLRFQAYADTGASYSLFQAEVAEMLGLDLEKGEFHEMTLGDGKVLKVFVHKILISVADKEFVASIGFSRGIGIGFYVLGRKDIFEHFIVCFNEKEKGVGFKPLDRK